MAGGESSSSAHRSHHRSSRSHRDCDHDREDTSSSRRRSRSPSPARSGHAILSRFGAPELTADDYFARSSEFKAWLADSKGKYLDEIPSKEARRYFDRFVRRWNEGQLPDAYYSGAIRSSSSAAAGSRHKWSFTSKTSYSKEEREQLEMVRDTVETMTNSESRGAREARDAERRAVKGRSRDDRDRDDIDVEPRSKASRGSYAENQYDREHREDVNRIARAESRRRERADQRDEEEALHGKATGRDRMIEARGERNAANREFANRRNADDGFEMDDRELYDADQPPQSLAASGSARDASRGMSKREQARQERLEERKAEMQERVSALKEKDAKTMEMFKAMAAERFGGS